VVAPPLATQVPETAHPPALQVVPLQAGMPGPPHPAHCALARQRSPAAHGWPAATQLPVAVLQQLPVQAVPPQQASPGLPHETHRPIEQVLLADAHCPPAQHAWPAPPQGTQVLLAMLHAAPAAVQRLLPQQGWPTPPQATQLPPWQTAPPPVHTFPVQQG
jgi:hypothetical protein